LRGSPHLSTRQYARIVETWVTEIGLNPSAYGTCQRQSKIAPPLIVSAKVKVDHPPGSVCAALARRA
jgi:hypothetical protein